MTGSALRKVLIFDINGQDLELTTEGNVPVSLRDSNGTELVIESNGGIPVNIQDQTTNPFSFRLSKVVSSTLSLAIDAVVEAYSFTLSPGHGVVVGSHVAIVDTVIGKVYTCQVLGVAGDVITGDAPLPFSFTVANSFVFSYSHALNVNGSVTTQIYELSNYLSTPLDVTRILFSITDDSVMDSAKFGGITALSRGIVLRKKESSTVFINYWNVKTNGDFGELMFDLRYDDRAPPPAGVYGFNARMTYAGQEKHGVVIRLEQGESLQLLIQDDLTGLTSFSATAEGHVVQN